MCIIDSGLTSILEPRQRQRVPGEGAKGRPERPDEVQGFIQNVQYDMWKFDWGPRIIVTLLSIIFNFTLALTTFLQTICTDQYA